MLEVLPGIYLKGKGIYHKAAKTVILGDTHIGQESALKSEGVLVPRLSFKDLKRDTEDILDGLTVEKILLNGDVKHNFGRISREEWDKTFEYISFLKEHGEVSINKGNHDVLVEPLVEKANLEVRTKTSIQNILVCHGHKIPEEITEETIIISHEHPAVSIHSGSRSERYKCFLKMRYKQKTLLVLPSMNTLNEGSDILSKRPLSPFISRKERKKADVFIVAQKDILPFGTVKDIESL